jgi:hypothetical protein
VKSDTLGQIRTTGWTASESFLAGGAVKLMKYNPLLRHMPGRAFAAKGKVLDPHRDYDYTDWKTVMRFAKAFVSSSVVKVAYRCITQLPLQQRRQHRLDHRCGCVALVSLRRLDANGDGVVGPDQRQDHLELQRRRVARHRIRCR